MAESTDARCRVDRTRVWGMRPSQASARWKTRAYKERRLKNDPATQRSFARATGGARTVPQIVVGEHLVGGFDDLVNLERSGELDVLLGRAEPPAQQSLWQRLKSGFRA